MKTILKTLMRYKTSTVLNIIGLSCAFATFIIISMQIRYDVTYDHYNENFESIYQLSTKDSVDGRRFSVFNRPTVAKFREVAPEVDYITVLGTKREDRITLLGDEQRSINQEIRTSDENITSIFTFEFIEGDESALKDPTNLIVSDKFAKSWYGDKSPIGQSISYKGTNYTSKGFITEEIIYTIAAVYKSFPENGTLQGDVFCNVGDDYIDAISTWNYHVFVKLNKSSLIETVKEKMLQSARDVFPHFMKNSFSEVTKLSDARYLIGGYDKNILYLMIIIALSIIVLAVINFINFATSMVPLKIKGINLRKVVGATQSELRVSMICESVTLALLSFLFAVGVVELFKDSSFSYIIYDVSWDTNKIVYLIALVVTLLTGVISGLYPAFYSTSFQPALMLKSSYALSASGRKFRTALIGFQFFVSLTFIAATIFIQLQYSHFVNNDGGYIKEGIVHVDHGWEYDKHEILKNELLKNSQIKDVAFARSKFATDLWGGYHWALKYPEGSMGVLSVSYNFLDIFEIKIDSGRNFTHSDYLSNAEYFVVNKLLIDEYNLLPGEDILKYDGTPVKVVGVCGNIHFSTMKALLKPHAFHIDGKNGMKEYAHSYIKVSGNSKDIFEHIQNSYKKIDPTIIIEANYFTTELDNAYSDENTTKQIMQAFSFIAIIIALVGVFGLVSFDTKYRRKEISLRRINGATVSEILTMFSTSYVKIMLISFVLSVPVVYYFIFNWLKDFPYKIDIYWWVFAVALLMVFALTLIISATQTISAAKRNPIEALKSE